MGKGTFYETKKKPLSYDTAPGYGDKIWMNPSTGVIYNFDESRNKWLSANKDVFEFARKGSTEGMYIPLLGDLDDVDDVYTSSMPATIIGIFCKSMSGEKNKTFEIRKNGELLYQFTYPNKRKYTNNSLDLDIELGDAVQVWITKDGLPVRNIVCRVGYAWRYVV